MTLSNLGRNIFIGDLAATSPMTSNKTGVYNLTPIKGSVMIGNGQSIICKHKRKLDVICKHKDGSMARETWDVKIVPQLNRDLFSFTKAMKEGWQMNGRWKEGGSIIDNRILSKTQKSFWYCSHMKCCLQNILYINLHILYIIHIKTSSKIQESRKSNKYIKSYQQNMIEFLEKYYFNM